MPVEIPNSLLMFIPLRKVNVARREVYGVMAEEAVDKSGEIFDYASSKPFVKAWSDQISGATGGKSFGNVRLMHQSVAIGKLIDITFDDSAKQISVVAKVTDDAAWNMVDEGVLNGFSVGGRYVNRWSDGQFIRYAAQPAEVSLVDNPCMYGAMFTAVKQDGSQEMRKFGNNEREGTMDMQKLEQAKETEVDIELIAKGMEFTADQMRKWDPDVKRQIRQEMEAAIRRVKITFGDGTGEGGSEMIRQFIISAQGVLELLDCEELDPTGTTKSVGNHEMGSTDPDLLMRRRAVEMYKNLRAAGEDRNFVDTLMRRGPAIEPSAAQKAFNELYHAAPRLTKLDLITR